MKLCNTCGQLKQRCQFSKNASKTDGLNSKCKRCYAEYYRVWYAKNQVLHKANTKRNKQRIIQENRERLWQIKLAGQCDDCGYNNPNVLEFDHIKDKRLTISEMLGSGYSWREIQKELTKCELVCSNCHTIRTAKRAGWYREFKGPKL